MFFFFFEKDKIISFAEKVFRYSSYDVIDEQSEDYDFLVKKQDITYGVMVKNKITNNQISKLDKLKDEEKQFIPLMFVLDDIEKESKELLTQKYNVEIIDISNIIYIIQGNSELMNELKEILDYSLNGIEKNEPNIRIEIENEEIHTKGLMDYVKELQGIKPGKKDWYKYQKFCVNLIKEMFNDDLDSWGEQEKTQEGSFIFDLIARVKYRKKEEYDDFFNMVENSLQSKYIVFEFKNYVEKIGKEEIISTESYLYEKALRKMAIIITRKGANESAKKEIRRCVRSYGKTIIVIDEMDLINMITLWKEDDDINPSIILQEKLNNLYIHLEQ